ncbi:receptor-like protein EIX1 [Salvia miltiorrhiza]|uniref:receptor-like protein EIX1 n=1 Tax=Salvia miltiorrhiza TaxID=226208 RepID=UPI0025AC6DC6|nr:receptor-like protein EIX1 [Salvia miltiorrhiza]
MINLPNEEIRPVYEYSAIQWKGQESEYRKNLKLLKLIDFSSNSLTGNIPKSFSSMLGLISLNLSRNSLTGNIIRDIGEMEMLECLDLSHNQFSGELPTSLAQLQYLAVLDLSNNDLIGKIPTSTQLQSFNASAYDENDGLCGPPLASCPEDSLRPSTTNPNEKDDNSLSFMQEVCISLGFGFIFGFWGVVGTFILKKSWRIAYFNFWDAVGDWFYVRIAVGGQARGYMKKCGRSVARDGAEVRCIEREREALLSFKNSLIGDDGILSSWRSDRMLRMIGNLTNLRSLGLSRNSLRSENLDWLSNLSLLSFLDLSQIDLSHTNWLQHIPSLHSLYELHLKSCGLKDNKPSSSSSSTSLLSILDLSNNSLTSSSFDWLSNISTSLVEIDLSQNALGGLIPNAFLESLVLIEHLDLSSNMLQGQVPKSLSNLSRLRVLVLYENDYRGDFDELFGNISAKGILESLQILDLAKNQLNGSVPDLRALSALTEVYLGDNNFTGSMPLSIGQLSELHILDLSRNSLEGSVSESHLIKLDKLKTLDLSFNSLILDIAPDWNPPFQLEGIFLAGCNVGPSFPKWIQTQRNFTGLDLSRGGIRDEAPTWLWTISPSLEALYLSDNQITGYVPNLSSTSMRHLDLSNNRFSGPIPLFYANARIIQLNGNMFSGSISSICEIPQYQLVSLDLSNNKLAGEIPNCWEKMPYLFSLNLADNRFSGEIARSLGSLLVLHALQLRGNNLSGELPSTLRLCQYLRLVDVGGNALTGEIPNWIGELYNMRYLNLRWNKFLLVKKQLPQLSKSCGKPFNNGNISFHTAATYHLNSL